MVTRSEAIAALTAPGGPFELEDLGEPGQLRVFKNAPRSLRMLYLDNLSGADFIVYGSQRFTFEQAYLAAAIIARILLDEYGVIKGDRVAIAMRNYPEWILSFMAVTSIGAVAVAVNARSQTSELVYCLRDSEAKVILADQERLDRIGDKLYALDARILAVRSSRQPGIDLLDERMALLGPVAMPSASIEPTDAAIIFYTSGSTGYPKGVSSTHRSIISALLSWELDAEIATLVTGVRPTPPSHQQAALLTVPLFHATGSHAVYLHSYRSQRKIVCMYRWDPLTAVELIERERITSLVAPAAVTGDLIAVAQQSSRDLSSLLSVGGGGAARAPAQVREIAARFGSAVPGTGWGMTETNSIGTGISGQDYLDHPTSSGQCSAVMELKVVDDDGVEVPTGQRGELLVRGTAMFREYWRRPDLNATAFTADGWFRTGDVALFDDEGYIYIVDRIKDLIIRGGENIGTGQVEAALLMHPDVHEAAVYGVPDDRLGEQVAATIYAKPTLKLETLRTFLDTHLASYEVPSQIFTTDQPLPRTASGKVLKGQLRDQAVAMLTPNRTAAVSGHG